MADQRFVFLEITHREISALLWHMQWTIAGTEPRHPVHLTVRGPYRREVGRRVLEKCRHTLYGDALRIGDIGRFSNPGQEVVFLHVDSPNLRRVWWKPNYPITKYGYTPHISLYRGVDAAFADRLAGFLRRERLGLVCNEFRLTVHLSDGLRFGADPPPPLEEADRLNKGGGVHQSLLVRLRGFVASCSALPAARDPCGDTPQEQSRISEDAG